MITLLSSVTSSTVSYVSVEEVIEKIKMGFWKSEVQNKEKINLPVIMWQGTFRERNNNGLVTPSNLIIFDYDKIPENELEAYKNYITEHESVRCAFISPSRNGLKVVVNIPFTNSEEYKSGYNAFAEQYPKYLDRAASDIARACFVSYDENVYDNDRCVPMKNETSMIIFNSEAIEKGWKELEAKGMKYENGNRNNFIFQLSSKFAKFGVEQDEAEKFLGQFSDLKKTEQLATLKSAYKSNQFGVAKHVVTNTSVDIDAKCLTARVVKEHIQNSYEVMYNTVLDRYEVDGEPLTDIDEDIMWADLDEKFKALGARKELSLKIFRSALALSATKYDPIKKTIESLKWDGVRRVDEMLSHFEDANNVMPVYTRHFLYGAIERLYKEFQNPLLVLDGRQGLGKSFFLAWLATPFSNYFKENGQISPNDKDSRLELTSNFLYDWSEGTNIGHKDLSALKSLIFSRTISERKAYARNTEKRKIIASIAITSNGSKILRDTTGNRRFHIVNLIDVDHSYSTKYKPEDIWAEVYECWLNNTVNWREIDKNQLAAIHYENFDEPAIWNYIRQLGVTYDKYDDTFLPMHLIYNSLKNLDHTIDVMRNNQLIKGYFEHEFKLEPRFRKIDGLKTLGYYGIKLKTLSTSYTSFTHSQI